MTVTTLNGVEARAVHLVAYGHVGRQITEARVFPVRSSDGARTYTVVLTGDPETCSCTCVSAQKGRRCKHIVAADLQSQVDAQHAADPVREWDNDYCHDCGTYIDPARGGNQCDDCKTKAVPA